MAATKKITETGTQAINVRLHAWMRFVCCFCGACSMMVGAAMVAAYDWAYLWMGMDPNTMALPIQLAGWFYVLMGAAIAWFPQNPERHASILMLAVYAKIGSSIFVLAYAVSGQLNFALVPVALIVDTIFVLPLWRIYKHVGDYESKGVVAAQKSRREQKSAISS